MKKLFIAIAAMFAPAVTWAQEAANTVTTTVITKAADAAPVVTTIDFSGWATAAAPIIVTLFGILLVAGINWLLKKTKTEKLAGQLGVQALVDKILKEATDYAVSNLKDANWLKVETKNEALGFALNYVEEHGGDIVKAAGLDTTKIVQKLEAKLIVHDTSPGVWTETPAIPAPATPAEPAAPAETPPTVI